MLDEIRLGSEWIENFILFINQINIMDWKESFKPTKIKLLCSFLFTLLISPVLYAFIQSPYPCDMLCKTQSTYPNLINRGCCDACTSLLNFIFELSVIIVILIIVFLFPYTVFSLYSKFKK